ncbi:hypothetical protein C7974DRAFT_437816 [Boeremia exigua]|uniref:uncharacterized protein n=1 Tax=Boeremia exigua TaxID=749465 RepID=UPI001E8E92E2|nr:uncharacterized protein C7974DRAFT_437816 [Boeremia exigua]KAH6612503.1 hypothetical protein C7974DRAFT_437816 [Boeremia exigua]
MATLAAHDQENAVRSLHVGPGGKPLGAKTPAQVPKTPFKVALNDENVFTRGAKEGKGLAPTTAKGGKLDASAFVTPAGPRSRAPLGAKTTNAKARAFQTPAPLGSSAKTLKLSPRLRRPKVKVHQPEPEPESEDDVPEIEHMPAREVPLPDDMDDYLPRDWDFSVLAGENAMRGVTAAYHNPVEADGRTKGQREFEEGLERDRKKRDNDFDRLFAAQMARDDAESKRYFGITETTDPKPAVKSTSTVRPTTGLSTMRARSAATALAPSRVTQRLGASSATAKARVPAGPVSGRKTPKPDAAAPARLARHASSAAVSSRSTIGYAQGRAVRSSSAMRPPLSNIARPAPRPGTTTPSFSSHHRPAPSRAFSRTVSSASDSTLVDPFAGSETALSVERELALLALQDDEGDEAWMQGFGLPSAGAVEDEGVGFQFKLPEGF